MNGIKLQTKEKMIHYIYVYHGIRAIELKVSQIMIICLAQDIIKEKIYHKMPQTMFAHFQKTNVSKCQNVLMIKIVMVTESLPKDV